MSLFRGGEAPSAASVLVGGIGSVALLAGLVGMDRFLHDPAALGAVSAAALAAFGVALVGRDRRGADAAPDTIPVAALDDLVTWHDRLGDVVRASPAATTLLGTGPSALEGGGLFARVHVLDRPAYLRALSEAAKEGLPSVVGLRLRGGSDEDGGPCPTVPVEMRVRPLAKSTGAAVPDAAFVAVFRDLSEERARAGEVEAAREAAERANELKGRFLATVSHELRTPLNAIIGFSELLAGEHPFVLTDDRRREYAGIIRESGTHLLEIVNTLLDMSKIESGNLPFEPESIRLAELAEACCELMRLKAERAGLSLVAVIEPDLPEIVGDRRACRQILINLLSNALKFTPPGGTVTVTLRRRDGRVELAVADTGIGVPEADLGRLGDAFFQSGELHGRTYEGTGLGLSVVRGLVGLHGGELAIDSGSGAGTTVTVGFPVRSDPVARLRPVPVAVKTSARLPRAGERKVA